MFPISDCFDVHSNLWREPLIRKYYRQTMTQRDRLRNPLAFTIKTPIWTLLNYKSTIIGINVQLATRNHFAYSGAARCKHITPQKIAHTTLAVHPKSLVNSTTDAASCSFISWRKTRTSLVPIHCNQWKYILQMQKKQKCGQQLGQFAFDKA